MFGRFLSFMGQCSNFRFLIWVEESFLGLLLHCALAVDSGWGNNNWGWFEIGIIFACILSLVASLWSPSLRNSRHVNCKRAICSKKFNLPGFTKGITMSGQGALLCFTCVGLSCIMTGFIKKHKQLLVLSVMYKTGAQSSSRVMTWFYFCCRVYIESLIKKWESSGMISLTWLIVTQIDGSLQVQIVLQSYDDASA